MSKWKKRAYNIGGLVNYFYSVAALRYTRLSYQRLQKFFEASPVERLHVGCGLNVLNGWCNVLCEWRLAYAEVKTVNEAQVLNYNLLGEWPWPESSVRYVAGAHFIEHIDLNHCVAFCSQAFKVLKPGGVIRLSCPDLEIYARNYLEGNSKFFDNEYIKKACVFKTALVPSQIFAAKAYDSGGAHKWFHDFSSLKSVLERVGFTNIRKVGRLEGRTPDLELLELPGREVETVYVEAEKPV
jgi:hypothetical protein